MISNIILDGICADCAFLEIHVFYGLAIATQFIRLENITLLDRVSKMLCREKGKQKYYVGNWDYIARYCSHNSFRTF